MRVVGGEYRGRRILTCDGPGYRPATMMVRESVFSMLEARGVRWPGLRAADLFAGSGSLGIECLSRGADMVWFVEQSAKAAGLITKNLNQLKVSAARGRVVRKDVLTALTSSRPTPFDLVFIDPPYGKDLLASTLDKVLETGWVAEGGFVVAEVEASLPVPDQGAVTGLELVADREYGQTRIIIWRN